MIGGEYNFDSIIGKQAVGDGFEHDVIHGSRGRKYQLLFFFLHFSILKVFLQNLRNALRQTNIPLCKSPRTW
jgi:hypothetical protein